MEFYDLQTRQNSYNPAMFSLQLLSLLYLPLLRGKYCMQKKLYFWPKEGHYSKQTNFEFINNRSYKTILTNSDKKLLLTPLILICFSFLQRSFEKDLKWPVNTSCNTKTKLKEKIAGSKKKQYVTLQPGQLNMLIFLTYRLHQSARDLTLNFF